jgi:ribosome-associated protein
MKTSKTKKAGTTESEKIVKSAVLGLQEKKGEDILIMDLRNSKNAVADFFVLATGNSRTQVEALARSVDETIFKELAEDPWHIEGKINSEWVLIDYVSVVVHVFQQDSRSFYNLEKLWGDAEFTHIK